MALRLLVRPLRGFRTEQFDVKAILAQRRDWPKWLTREMRSNHAGETGAVSIYRGGMDAARRRDDAGLIAFVAEHQEHEEEHLRFMDAVVEKRSWMPAAPFGYALGYLSVRLGGPVGFYRTTNA